MKKYITVPVETDTLTDPELKTAFIQMFGRDKYEQAVDPSDSGDSVKFTEQEVASMSDSEFEKRREEILDATSKGQVR